MDNKSFKVEDLVQDPGFRAWVNGKDPDASLFWENWLLNNPNDQDKVEQASQIVRSLSYLDGPMPPDRKKEVWNAIRANTIQPDALPKNASKNRGNENVNLWATSISKIAATILVLVAFGFVFSVIRDSNNESKLAKNVEKKIFEKETDEGQRIRFKLPDGSLVYLNSASKVIYKTGHDGLSREVYLQGEAFFDVESNKNRPFKVYANSMEITALGTEFNVKNGKTDSHTEVSLVEGKVEVVNLASESKEALYLNEGERAFLDPSEKTMTKSTFGPELVNIWKNGILLFEDTSIVTVKEVLERWYGVKIIFQNKHATGLKVTGRFEKEHIANVLESLSYTARFEYKMEDKTVYIRFKRK